MSDAAPPEPELARDAEWQRLDPRMLLVYPVRELGRFLLPLVVLVVAGTATQRPWQYLFVVVPVGLGLLRYVTTGFRVTGGRVELRRGLLSRHVLSAPVDRVRTVDLTASPIHRLLGLTTVTVGTGTASTDGDEKLALDGLPVARAHALRAALLRVTPSGSGPGDPTAAPPAPHRTAVALDLGWLRFAPFTSSGVVIAAALVGVVSQLLETIDFYSRLDPADWTLAVPLWGTVLLAIAGLGFAAAVLSVLGYAVTNWGFRLTHGDGSWHVSRGLLTTRETSVDDERLAGVSIGEPLGLRLARGARLNAIVTGLRTAQGGSGLVPPAPRAVVDRAAADVLGTRAPVAGVLRGHGAAATRRRYARALVPAVAVLLACVTLWAAGLVPTWLPVASTVVVAAALGLAHDRARALGHDLVEGHLVARSGSLMRAREALATDHVIGWNLRATWFQRRVGLTSLVATTAGGRQSVTVVDVPEQSAVALAATATPALLAQFRA